MQKQEFGKNKEGRTGSLYTLTNAAGSSISVSDFGALLVSVKVPDKDGVLTDVVLGYDGIEEYQNRTMFFGACVGRSGNRIAKATFTLDGKEYHLTPNENGNNLHSNPDGYHDRFWEVKDVQDTQITFHLDSPDGDQGFPGNLSLDVTYALSEDNTVSIHYQGTSDQDTVVNMTNHSYFNLAGHQSGSIEDQTLCLCADYYTPVIDPASIPTGELAPVQGTPMDFTSPKAIGRDIEADFEQLQFTGGFDHNFVLRDPNTGIRTMAEAYSSRSGIAMTASTDCVGVQFYAGNFVVDHTGKGGAQYHKRSGFCLESQFYPNAVNTPGFPSPVLKAGEAYDTTTAYHFYVK